MAARTVSILGVLLVTGGTIWSLWDIIVKTDKEMFQELAQRFSLRKQMRSAKEERRHTISGLACILLGAVMQIIGVVLM